MKIKYIILSLALFLFASCKTNYENFYKIGNDTVSSVYKIIGLEIKPKVEKFHDNYIYTFKNDTNALYNSVKYANYLWKNEGYYITQHNGFGKENGNVELAKSSIDPNKVIRINIHSYTNNSFHVIISLVNGTIKLKNNTNN